MKVPVLHLVDSLAVGGLERVAVNLANALPQDSYESHLCWSRAGGPLLGAVGPGVRGLDLGRRSTFDLAALFRLRRYVHRQGIRIVHAHGSSLFLGAALRCVGTRARVLWHIHFGKLGEQGRAPLAYRVAAGRMSMVIAVSQALADWARTGLGLPGDRVVYMPNFVTARGRSTAGRIPRKPGERRIVCVANLRAEKDHANLLAAMDLVRRRQPGARLWLVGAADTEANQRKVDEAIVRLGLGSQVEQLGLRTDVPDLLADADVGVISSYAEGLPLALLEYCLAGLPCVVTDVGQCREVLGGGRTGCVVPPRDPAALAEGILRILEDPRARERWGEPARQWVLDHFGEENLLRQLLETYDRVLGGGIRTRQPSAERFSAGVVR